MIKLSIDVTQLDKSRFKPFQRKNGKNAMFCELVLIETPNSEYGDYVVKQDVTKEEREAKKEMPILGNGKVFGRGGGGGRGGAPRTTAAAPQGGGDDDDLPF